jgi:hypothetical protein
MARGRPRKEPETHGNVSQSTLLEFHDELVEAYRLKASADGALRNVYKRAEQAGLDRKTLKRAYSDAQKAENERQVDDERYRRYMAWLGVPVGTQAEMTLSDEDESQANGEDTEAVEQHKNNMAFEEGVSAGKAGANAASNPHPPGSEAFQAFSLGWSAGQKETVMALGGTTRRVHPAA